MAVTSFVAKLKWVASNWRRIGVDFAGNVGGDPGSGSGQGLRAWAAACTAAKVEKGAKPLGLSPRPAPR